MIPAYDTEDFYGFKERLENEFEDYTRSSFVSGNHELITRVIKNWMKYKNIDFVDMIILSDMVDNEKYLNKIELVNDLSYRNCTIYLSHNGIRSRAPESTTLKLETNSKIWESKGFEKLFISVDDVNLFMNEETDIDEIQHAEELQKLYDSLHRPIFI